MNLNSRNVALKIFSCVFMIAFLISLTFKYADSPLKYTKYVLMIIFIIFFIINNIDRKIIINKNVRNISLILIFSSYFTPIIELLFRQSDNKQVVLYSILCFIFTIFSLIISIYLQDEIKKVVIIRWYLVTIGLFVLYMFLRFNSSYSFKDIFKVFNNYNRVRNNFGFSHVNTLGNITMSYLILDLYNSQILKNNSKIISIFRIFIIYILIRTASRTAILCTSIFYITYLTSIFIEKIKVNKTIKRTIITLLVLFISIYTIKLIGNPDFLEETNRYYHLKGNIMLILNSNNWIIGLGNVNPLNIYMFNIGISVNDNWFVYLFITQGLKGIFFIIIIFFIKIKCLIGVKNTNMRAFYLSLLIVNLIMAMFEMSYYVPGVLSSAIYWILVFAIIQQSGEKY